MTDTSNAQPKVDILYVAKDGTIISTQEAVAANAIPASIEATLGSLYSLAEKAPMPVPGVPVVELPTSIRLFNSGIAGSVGATLDFTSGLAHGEGIVKASVSTATNVGAGWVAAAGLTAIGVTGAPAVLIGVVALAAINYGIQQHDKDPNANLGDWIYDNVLNSGVKAKSLHSQNSINGNANLINGQYVFKKAPQTSSSSSLIINKATNSAAKNPLDPAGAKDPNKKFIIPSGDTTAQRQPSAKPNLGQGKVVTVTSASTKHTPVSSNRAPQPIQQDPLIPSLDYNPVKYEDPTLSVKAIINGDTIQNLPPIPGYTNPYDPSTDPTIQANNNNSVSYDTGSFDFFINFDPLVLDLQNNGLETISAANSNALFDMQGDGFLHKTSWVSKNDALLAIDRNQNGLIDDVNELFGWTDKTGFNELRSLDTNHDNVIDASDAQFNLLRVWQDANENGATDPGELITLAAANIKSISLTTRTENYDNNGNHISESAVFTHNDGSTSRVFDATFNNSNTYTQASGNYTISTDLLTSPWIRGYGAIQDLLVVASQNDNLKTLVLALASQANAETVYNSIDQLISLWAGTPLGGQVPQGQYDLGKAQFVENFLGLNSAFASTDVSAIESSYQTLKNKIFVDFIAQTSIGYSLGLNYDFSSDAYAVDPTILYNQLVENLSNTQTSYMSFVIAQTLQDAQMLNLGQLSDAIQRHGYGDFLLNYLNQQNNLIPQNTDGSVTGDNLDNLLYSTSATGVLFQGNDGNDVLVSTLGNDTLQGGNGNDTYILDLQSGLDTISDASGTDQLILGAGISQGNLILTQSGNDLLLSVGTTQFATVQNFYTTGTIEKISFIDGTSLSSTQILAMTTTLTGTAGNDVLLGNNFVNSISGAAGNDTLTGGAGNDTLDGGTGVDSMSGGTGDDTYVVDNAGDVVVENAFEGTDTIQASVSYTLSSNVENLILTGSSNLGATGNELSNIITSNTGLDTLTGGLGDDTYILSSAADSVVENASAGTDTVQVGASYTLGSNVENLTLTGASTITGTGNSLDNVLTGNTAVDTLAGGTGNDTYIIQNAGTVINESASEGTDTVQTSVSYTLGTNLENLTLTGTSALSGAGNTQDNTLTGNNAASTLAGGTGNDTYIIQNAGTVINENLSAGTDTVQTSVSYTLAANLENLTLTGSSALAGTGNTLNNTLTGNTGDNTLDGGAGVDTLIGGTGNDTYIVDNAGDVVTENASEGTDTVQASVNYSLAANVENLTFTGAGALSGQGNSSDNVLTGNTAVDTLAGGTGNDTYIIQNAGTVINENASEGTDTVQTSVSYTLGANLENLTLTGGSALSGAGNTQDNTLTGNNAASTLAGGTGNDTYIIQNAGTVINENLSAGTDTVQTSVSYTLGANLESLTLTGTSSLTGTGNTLNNTLTGNTGDNTLDGGTGADTLIGGTGNDTYIVDNSGDTIVENASEGVDNVQASVTYTLANFVENLTLTGASAINGTGTLYDNLITGNSAANVLQGLAGNDTLDGGAGADTLLGGMGNDTYIVDNSNDVVSENINEGTDTVQASVSYTLGSNVENLTLTGASALTGAGNTLDNVLTGNSAIDTLVGGIGNDTYVLQNAATMITENASEGTDTVQVGANYTLGTNLENLTLTGTTALTGTGNAADNVLTGNTAADTLVGGIGNDTYIISNSNTVISENANEGTDLVQASDSYSLGANLENLTLTGSTDTNATGNSLNNTLLGNSGSNILDGGLGADTMTGGLGNDTYIVDNVGDVIVEQSGEGTDTVHASITYSLGQYLENLVLTGSSAINGTGNDAANILVGNSANNSLLGGLGNDTLDGGLGADTLIGGMGNDTYLVDNPGDVVIENAGEGTDSVQANTDYTLSANVEYLTLVAGASTVGVGNSLANWIVGNSNNNTLTGLDGNDTLDGGVGADTMTGGTGNDLYLVDNAGDVVIENANEGTDTVQSTVSYTLGSNIEDLVLAGTAVIDGTGNSLANYIVGNNRNNTLTGNAGNDTLNGGSGADTLIGGTGDDTYIVDNSGDVVTENASEGNDTVLASVSYALSSNVENLSLTGTLNINATGNSLNNILIGNTGDNILDGGSGIDTLIGGTGNDTYIVDNAGDLIVENVGEGTDTVQASISYTLGTNLENLSLATGSGTINGTGNSLNNYLVGNESNNTLTGLAGDDTLDGGAGADTLLGGTGNDTYIVDNAGDVVTENASEGTDTVQASVSYTLSSNVENMTLTGTVALLATGNSLDNVLSDNGAVDTLVGGTGNDTYILQNAATVVTENASEGTDTVQIDANYTLGANLENLTLTGYDDVVGTGNTLNNVLTGNSGNNTLDGGTGADTLIGGLGNDTYIVDNAGDVVTENTGEGTDTVQASVSYTLGANIENLTLTGASALTGTGNTLDNVLTGNSAIDTLVGGTGNDTYVVQNSGTVITENASEGTDTVQANVSYTLGANLENLTLTGTTALTGTGNTLGNTLTGNTAIDTLAGGTGNDTYILQNAATVITENASEGTDTVQVDANYTLGTNLENLTLTGTDLVNGTGNTLDNWLVGNTNNNVLTGLAGNDTLDGGGGNDTLIGGTGNDTYLINNTGITLTENVGEGTDTVQASINYSLDANIENLTLTGTAALSGTGNSLNNVLTGNTGDNTLDGGTGADTLIGGTGNDTYVVDNAGDVVTENTGEGTDTVQASINYTLGANLENLTLTGSANLIGTGNTGDNVLTGNSGSSTLIGGIGNDTYVIQNATTVITENASEGTDTVQTSATYSLVSNLNLENLTLTGNAALTGTGNSGNNVITGNNAASTLAGGVGNDTYIVSSSDNVIVENVGEGTDTVQSSINYTLSSNVENLTLTGSDSLNGTGNTQDNYLTGNSNINTLVGLDGNDTLDGGSGADFLYGGLGNDTYIVDNLGDVVVENAGEGTDTVQATVSYTLSSNVENLTLTGTSGLSGTGNSLNNTLIGNSGDNTLDGGTGADTLTGGTGNDTYIVDNAGDVITENASEGTDTVQASINYTLGTNVENLVLTGSANLTGTGNTLDNVLTGNSGADTLAGGTGNDTYILQNASTVVTENASAGTDIVQIGASYTLGANLENLTLTGTGNFTGTGNSSNNSISGNTGDNTLDGGTGADTLIGGLGNDTYIVDNAGDVVTENSGEGIDTVQASVSYTLSSYVENLTLTGTTNINGTGSVDNNYLIGNSGSNSLSGGAGDDTLDGGTGGTDTLVGGLGNDTYIINSASTVLVENPVDPTHAEGVDTVIASISYTLANYFENLTLTGTANLTGTGTIDNNVITGNSGNNVLTGLAGNDTIDGGVGADTLIGGTGDDTYVVNNVGDVITENAGEGTDTVQASISYVLGANIENLTLTSTAAINATGNAVNNLLVGNSGDNVLDGGVGSDTMMGGLGNDTYVVDNTGDMIVETANAGIDTVHASIDYSLSANLENLVLTGTTAVYGTGNASDNILVGNTANNILTGGLGNDTLDGGAGVDTLIGGTGNDTYVVDNAADIVSENAGEGTDTVLASVSYALGNNVENLTLTGTTAINGTGNSLDNILTGNSGNNLLDGGSGNDTYAFSATVGNDTITDASGTDTLDFSQATQALSIDLSSTGTTLGGQGKEALLPFTGTDGSTTITDLAGNTWTAMTGATIGSANPWLTGQKEVVNTGSGYLKTTTAASGLSLNGNNYGVHVRARLDNSANPAYLVGGLVTYSLRLCVVNDKLTFLNGNGSSWFINSLVGTTAIASNTWYDVELDYSNTTGYKVFLNGNLELSSSLTTQGYDSGGIFIGAEFDGSNNAIGAISDVYINNMATLHTGNFTPSLTPATLSGTVAWTPNVIENVKGGSGNDTLLGTSGDNILTGGAGNDSLTGGAGNDTYAFASGFGTDTINDASGTDTLDFSAFTTGVNVNLSNTSFTQSTGNVVNWTANTLENLTTGSGDDSLTGNTGNNLLNAGAGNNTLTGGAGNDTLVGGSGNDTYVFATGFGTDTLTDALGFNTLDLSSYTTAVSVNLATTSFIDGANTLSWSGSTVQGLLSGTGTDTLVGNTADNLLNGGAGNDSLTGDLGNDTLIGGSGNDSLDGGAGNDTYTFATSFGTDTITDASGTDTLDFSAFTTALTIDLSTTAFTQSAGNVVNWTANTIENVTGGSGNDSLSGSTGDNTLSGGAGNDTLNGGAGNDSYAFAAGFGTDTITDASGTDTLDFSAFTTALSVNLGSTSFTQSTGNVVSWASNALENLTTGSGDDTLTGNASNNVLTAGNGNNTLNGGAGNDTLNGGTGNDSYVFASGFGTDTISDTSGSDTLDFSAFTTALSIDLTTTTFTQSAGNTVNWASNAIENLTTGSGDDTLTGNASDNLLNAGNGNNTLNGGAGNDTLIGGTGNDTYIFSSGFGIDSISDAGGTDSIDFSALSGNLAVDLSGSTFNALSGDIVLWNAGQLENLTTNAGNGTLTGNATNNVLTAGSGNDTLSGLGGNDTLNGGAGNDTYVFAAGMGNDSIIDSSGTDTLDFSAFNTGLTIDLTSNSVLSPANLTSTQKSVLNFNNQTDGSTTIPDLAGNTWTAITGASISSTNPWLTGEKEVANTGSGYLKTTTAASGLSLNGNSYGVHLRTRLDNSANPAYLVGGLVTYSLRLCVVNGKLDLLNGTGSSWFISGLVGTTAISSNTWYDVELDYSNSTGYKVFLNGNLEISSSLTTKGYDSGGIFIGAEFDGSNNAIGALADIYVNNTQTLHDTTFTPLSNSYQSSFNDSVTWTGSTLENAVGGAGNDTITGTAGDNIITGGAGNDSLSGGAGNDTYVFATGFGTDTINDASGTDTLDFSAFSSALSIDLSTTSFTQSTGNVITWGSGTLENLTTGTGDDTLTGSSGNNILNGGSGNNTINGGAGNDTLMGGIDSDTYVFATGFGTDSIIDAAGHNTLDFSAVTSALTYTAGSGTASAGTGSVSWNTTSTAFDQIVGTSGNDSITGSTGNETLMGGAGNDTLTGGAGNDTYVFASGFGTDTITDASGTDTLDFSAVTDALSYNATTRTATASTSALSWSAGSTFEQVMGGSGNNSLTGSSGNETLIGGIGNDTLTAGQGNDLLQGGAGNNTYVFNLGDGTDIVNDVNANPGNMDTVLFGNTVSSANIALFMINNDLQVGYTTGSGDLITIQGQKQDTTTIERFQLNNGTYMTDADVNQVLANMTTYAANNNISLSNLNDVKNNAGLMSLVTAGWHS